jgi:hypothetical protein
MCRRSYSALAQGQVFVPLPLGLSRPGGVFVVPSAAYPRQNERSTMEHRIIGERIMRVVTLEAADVRENSQHIMNDRPISAREQQAVREAVDDD